MFFTFFIQLCNNGTEIVYKIEYKPKTILDMAKRNYKTSKRYTIHYLTDYGFCYRSRGNCPYSYVVEQRRLAKEYGEKIEVEYEGTIKIEY